MSSAIRERQSRTKRETTGIERVGRRCAIAILPASLLRLMARWRGRAYIPLPGAVRFGDLRRRAPISRHFGFDRGQPIDRYYVEKFLAQHAHEIRGRVLEIGDDTYTRQFGAHRVAKSDVLNLAESRRGTFVGDLTGPDDIPSMTFDCVIVTQTLQYIYDAGAAVATLHRILKPGGIVLATVPGVSQIGHGDWDKTWYWGFTCLSAQRLFEEVFSEANVTVEAHGNVLAALSFLHGLGAHELGHEELDYRDQEYQTLITIRAEKG